MAWIDKIQSDLIITTGDGRQFKPLWKPTKKGIEFNVAEFEFPELEGTLVKRGKMKGRKFDIEIYFNGANCIDDAQVFEQSSKDSRPWTIFHPYHGSIFVQPTALSFDYTNYNSVGISGTIIETIVEDNPKVISNPVDNIPIQAQTVNIAFLYSFGTNIIPSASDNSLMLSNNKNLYAKGKLLTKIQAEAESYYNFFNKANTAILNATAAPLEAIRAIKAFCNYPALFTVSVKTRLDLLTQQFQFLRIKLPTTKSGKKLYENNVSALITSQTIAAITPIDGDYKTRDNVLYAIQIIINNYNLFLSDLDLMQSANGGSVDSYIPDADSMTGLNNLINLSVAALFGIALNSKQERSIILEDDSNWIILAHRLYSLDPSDANIQELIDNNNAGLNEMLQVKKGRKIIYYI